MAQPHRKGHHASSHKARKHISKKQRRNSKQHLTGLKMPPHKHRSVAVDKPQPLTRYTVIGPISVTDPELTQMGYTNVYVTRTEKAWVVGWNRQREHRQAITTEDLTVEQAIQLAVGWLKS